MLSFDVKSGEVGRGEGGLDIFQDGFAASDNTAFAKMADVRLPSLFGMRSPVESMAVEESHIYLVF